MTNTYNATDLCLICEKINNLIKSKWEALEELDIRLPTVRDIKEIIVKTINDRLDYLMSNRYNTYNKAFVYIEEESEKLALRYMTTNGSVDIGAFVVNESKRKPGIALSVHFEGTDGRKIDSNELFLLQYLEISSKINTNADIFTLFVQLPEVAKREKHNWVCPSCGMRTGMYIGSFGHPHNKHAIVCSNCSYTGYMHEYKSDCIDAWSRDVKSDFNRARNEIVKQINFTQAMDASVEAIKRELQLVETIKNNKKMSFSKIDVVNYKIRLLNEIETTFSSLISAVKKDS